MKIVKSSFIIFLGIVIITSIKTYFFSEWTFTDRLYYNLFWATHYSSFVLCFFSLLIIFLKQTPPKILCVLTAIIISYFIFDIQFNPIDTSKYPIDKKVLFKNENKKIIVREMNKGKSNEMIKDTVNVKDIFIFRKIL
ncbi:hypothetical protein [Epilithonimonas lactis]|nr:hypothetical protein [Epilithonimonas lactis]SEQ58121.1 hypothetical protein SAMN04488097_2556 [Epilithonimonas lactis]